jgi:hypothetical protein
VGATTPMVLKSGCPITISARRSVHECGYAAVAEHAIIEAVYDIEAIRRDAEIDYGIAGAV